MEAASKYINTYKKDYILDYKSGSLIITRTSCYKVSKEVAFLISFLPRNGEKETYLECLRSLEIVDCQSMFNKLISLGILEEKHDIKFTDKLKNLLYRIFNPQILILPSNIQERILGFNFLYKIKQDTMLKITSIFTSLVLILGLLINNIFMVNNMEVSYGMIDFFNLIAFMLLGIIFHELGHSYMCSYCGIGLRPICFSVYLIYPVMFTNVSGIDELNLKQRILVNIAGLFAQGIYMIFLIFLFLITKQKFLLLCIQMLFTIFYFNFHPFIRTDGYWFFRDILYFIKDSKRGKVANNIYYFLYFLFSVRLIYKGILIIKNVVSYFSNFTNIKLDVLLIMNLFYIYLIIILFKAIKNRFMEFYERFIRRTEESNYAE